MWSSGHSHHLHRPLSRTAFSLHRYQLFCEQSVRLFSALQKEVYPYIGLQNSTSSYNVERGIRTAIIDASKKECFQLDCFHEKDKIVSNRFFLEYLLDKLRIYKNRQNN